jgi:hypothetical protein
MIEMRQAIAPMPLVLEDMKAFSGDLRLYLLMLGSYLEPLDLHLALLVTQS